MTNIEKLALDICRMKHSEKVLAALEDLMPVIAEALQEEEKEGDAA